MRFTKIKEEHRAYIKDKFRHESSVYITIGRDDNMLYVEHAADLYHHETIKSELKRYLKIYGRKYYKETRWDVVFQAQRPEELFPDIKEETL